MDKVATTQSQRSEEMTWTGREYELAEKHQVEPKLIRLLTELLDERELSTQRNLAKYLRALIATTKETPAKKVESETEPAMQEIPVVQPPGDVEAAEELRADKITTGISRLDAMIKRKAWDAQGAMYGCMKLARQDSELGEKILAMLRSELQPFFKTLHPERDQDGDLMDTECEVMPVVEWLAMVDGFQVAGGKLPDEQEIEELLDEQDEPETVARHDEPELETKANADEERQAAAEEQEPERVSYGFDPKEKVQAYKVFKQWLENRTLDEKRTALALTMLLSKQQYLPDEQIGDKMYKQWRDEVLSVSNLDQLQFKGVPGNEAFSQGYLTAMIVMDG